VVAGYGGASTWKNFTAKMRDTWRGVGMGVAAMFESTANRALSGFAAGVADGKAARKYWRALGMPDECFIAYAVDVNVNSAQIQGPVADYFRGVASVDTAQPWAYIENDGIRWLFAHHLIDGGFQPDAWGWGSPASPDAWDAHAYWRQERNGVALHGGDVDTGHILDTSNFWRAPGSPAPSIGEEVTPDDITRIWHAPELADESGKSDAVSPASGIEKARNAAEAAQAGVAALAAAVAKLPTTAVPATCNCPTLDQIKAAVKAEIESIKVTAV
jgi:hypothetical protein